MSQQAQKMNKIKAPDRASQLVADVRARISDEALQRKYGFPTKKSYLYKDTALVIIAKEDAQQSRCRIVIDPREFLTDIRSGMDDEALMIRYGFQPRQLHYAFRRVTNAGLATPLEL
jgi:hypothetical protein